MIGFASNSYLKTHPTQKRYADMAGMPYKQYVHAEVLAIIRALKNGSPHKIVIERYNKDGSPALAKPCPICDICIKESGIQRVEYTC